MVVRTLVLKVVREVIRMERSDKVYILNPAYRLRQDGNRAILVSFDDHVNEVDDWFSFIHPLHAQILAFFSVPRPFEDVLSDIAHFLKFSEGSLYKLLKPFLMNEGSFSIRQGCGQYVHFPPKVLVEWDGGIVGPSYSISDFNIDGQPDFTRYRLTSPININMELTMKCYVDCQYCYAKRSLRDQTVLTKEELISFIQEAKQAGVLVLDINGGEVLMHPDIFEILQTLLANGYSPLISTKMPIGDDTITKLQEIGIRTIQVSLDSANSKTLKKLVKASENYLSKMAKSLSAICSHGLNIDINVVVTSLNGSVENLSELLNFLRPYSTIRTVRINPCGYSLYKNNYQKIAIGLDQIRALERFIAEKSEEYPFNIQMSGYEEECLYASSENKQKAFQNRAICTGNIRNAVLLPNGEITICEELYDNPNFVIGNIRKQSLSEIWNSEKALSLYEYSIRKSKSLCHTCPEVKECRMQSGVCWKIVLMSYGQDNWDFPDPRCPKAPYPYNIFYSR